MEVGDDPLHVGVGHVVAEHEPLQAAQVLLAVLRRVRGARRRPPRTRRARLPPAPRRPRARRSGRAARARRPGCSGPRARGAPGPARGAVSDDSIFMLSRTATTSPASTSSPSATGIETTTPGAWLRTIPPSSWETRWGTPSTSTSRWVPCSEITVRWLRPPTASRRSWSLRRSTSTSTVGAVDRHAEAAGRHLEHPEAVALPFVGEIEGAAHLVAGLGAPAARVGVEARAVGGVLRLGELDHGLEEGDVGVGRPVGRRADPVPVEPGGVHAARPRRRGARAARAGTPGWCSRPRSGRWSRAARDAGARGPRRGRGRGRSPSRSSSRSPAGSRRRLSTPRSTRSPGPLGRFSSSTRPGEGAKSMAGSSAFSRASMAWPAAGGGSPSSRPPAATWS